MKASREYGEINLKKTGCDFGCDFCPFLSTFVHSHKQKRPPKLEAFVLKTLSLRLYARGDSNPQPLAPEANALFFEIEDSFSNVYTLLFASNQIGVALVKKTKETGMRFLVNGCPR